MPSATKSKKPNQNTSVETGVGFPKMPTRQALIEQLRYHILGDVASHFGITRGRLTELFAHYQINPKEHTMIRCPTDERLIALLENNGVQAIATMFNVSRAAVYNWVSDKGLGHMLPRNKE